VTGSAKPRAKDSREAACGEERTLALSIPVSMWSVYAHQGEESSESTKEKED